MMPTSTAPLVHDVGAVMQYVTVAMINGHSYYFIAIVVAQQQGARLTHRCWLTQHQRMW
jgi:hypothetical protein